MLGKQAAPKEDSRVDEIWKVGEVPYENTKNVGRSKTVLG